ncbi:MAG: hypothetical protein E7363_05330 [Clostridiales bacterium]|nr:hypothetical protein [Clostridiales bacterium]
MVWNPFRRRPVKLGLALGSGGAKGMAHVGALKAFSEYGIEFDIVTGTSIGSIVGAAYADGMNWQEIYNKVSEVDLSSVRKKGILAQLTMTDSERVTDVVSGVFGAEKNIEDLKKPFAAVSVNLKTGEEVVLTKGNLAKSVTASSAIAPVFSPVVMDDKHLIDGAYLNPIPADVARALGADVVIAIDLSSKKSATTESLRLFDVLIASVKIAMRNARYKGYHNSNVVIHPDLNGFKATKFDRLDEMFEVGYQEAIARMPEILEVLRAHHIKVGAGYGNKKKQKKEKSAN